MASLKFIEPEIAEEELLEDEDVAMDDEVLDVADILGDDIKANPQVDYDSRPEGDDVGFSASQLDLF